MTDTLHRQGRTLHIDDQQPTFWKKFAAGAWEPETLALLDRLLTAKTTFLDIGAWVGPTALWAAFTARRVLALEADPAALQQLHRNLAANPTLSAHIEVIDRALHPEPGKVPMGARRKPGDSMSSTLLAHGGDSSQASWQADTITPADLSLHIASEEDLVIKMDIEGGEYALLPVMLPLLRRARAMLISFHPELIQTMPGWTLEKARHHEDAFFSMLPDFTVTIVGGSKDSATREWLLQRNAA